MDNSSLKRSASEAAVVTTATVESSKTPLDGEPQKKKRKRSSYFRVLKSSSPSSPAATTPRRLPRITPKSTLKTVTFNLPDDNDDDNNKEEDNNNNTNNITENSNNNNNDAIAERSFLDVVGIHTPASRKETRAEALRRTLDEMDAPVRPLKFNDENDDEDNNNNNSNNTNEGTGARVEMHTEDTLQREWTVKTVLRFYSARDYAWALPTEADRTLALEYANAPDVPPGASAGARIAHAAQHFAFRNEEGRDGRLLDALNSLYALELAGALTHFYVLGESFAMLVRDSQAYVHPPSILRAFSAKMAVTSARLPPTTPLKSKYNENGSGENDEDEDNVEDNDNESSSPESLSPLNAKAKAKKMNNNNNNKRSVGGLRTPLRAETEEERELKALYENSKGFVPVRMPGDLTIEEVLAMAAESVAKPPEVVQGDTSVRALFSGLAASSLAARALVLSPKAFPGGALACGAARTYPVHRKTAPGVFEDVNAFELTGYVFNDRFRRVLAILRSPPAEEKDAGSDESVDESFSAGVEVVPSTAFFNTHSTSMGSSSSLTTTNSNSNSTPGASQTATAGLFVSRLKWSKSKGSLSYTLTKGNT